MGEYRTKFEKLDERRIQELVDARVEEKLRELLEEDEYQDLVKNTKVGRRGLMKAGGVAMLAFLGLAGEAKPQTASSYLNLTNDIGITGLPAPFYDSDAARKIDVDDHANLTSAHSATVSATADRIILRDAFGRAKVAAPSASDDIARKAEVDSHSNLTTGVHGVGAGGVVGTTLVQTLSNKTLGSDLAAGGFKITGLGAPVAAADAARKQDVDAKTSRQLLHFHTQGLDAGSAKYIAMDGHYTSDIAGVLISSPGTLKNFRLVSSNNPAASVTYTIVKNGVETSFTAVQSAGTNNASNTSSTLSVTAGDRITIKAYAGSATNNYGEVNITLENEI